MAGEPAVFLRALLGSLLANLPMLALLLVPQLMRSRAGSETRLLIGTSLYLGLILAALVSTPRVTAWLAPNGRNWSPRTANQSARTIRRTRPRIFWLRIAEWLGLFVLAQCAGFLVAWVLPYIEDNPRFGIVGEPRWVLDYGRYVVQAITVYFFSCVSFAHLGVRLRALAGQLSS